MTATTETKRTYCHFYAFERLDGWDVFENAGPDIEFLMTLDHDGFGEWLNSLSGTGVDCRINTLDAYVASVLRAVPHA